MWSSSAAGGQRGFTLLEILIALAIVSVALAAVMRTTGMLTTNNGVLRDRALALMSAQNRLVELQLAPPVATVSRDRAPCPQGGLALVCETRLTDVVRGSRLATVEVFRDRQAGPGWPRSARRWTIRDRPMDRRRQSGFSLIEVIVAIMIMAIISLLSWRAIDSVSLTSRKLDARSDEITALQRVFDQFERATSRCGPAPCRPPARTSAA